MKALLKRPASELANNFGWYDTNLGELMFYRGSKQWQSNDGTPRFPEWFLEETEVFTKEDLVGILKELKSDTENTNAKFRLKLATMIGDLENQLK